MVKSVDGVVRHFKTFKSKLMFLFDESKYSQLRFFRKTIQNQVNYLKLCYFKFLFHIFRLEIMLKNMELKCLDRISKKTEFSRMKTSEMKEKVALS